MSGRLRSLALACALLCGSSTAHAWDPSRTHVGITERAVETSDVHRRWMHATGEELGWFTPLRIDPNTLPAETRRALVVAMRFGHADVGAAAAGGPGACPPQPAPTETLQRCVDGNLWETSALGWLRVGIALEATDRTRLLHHFVDAEDPAATTWRASGRHRSTWRRVERRAGGGLATRLGRGGFSGSTQSAIGWMTSTSSKDPFGPAALFAYQRAASLATTPAERDRHLALALVAAGALLHVVQDLAVPANARGDLLGMMVPLSATRGDRGSPLSEYARITFGRTMPTPVALSGRTEEVPPPKSIREVLLGDGAREGLVALAATHFFSDGRLPAPRVLDRSLDGAAAAAAWLGEDAAGLDPSERDGAVLQPWPAEAGYLRSKTGRALAAWSADDTGLVRGYLDRRVLREHALVLLPAAVAASIDTLELLWPQWPTTRHDQGANMIEIDADPSVTDRELLVVVEDPAGRRTITRRVALLPGSSRIRNISPATIPEGAHVVLVLTGAYADGQRVAIERRLDAVTTPDTAPPKTPPPVLDVPETPPPDTTTPPPATPDTTTPDATPPETTPGTTTPPAATPDAAPETAADPTPSRTSDPTKLDGSLRAPDFAPKSESPKSESPKSDDDAE